MPTDGNFSFSVLIAGLPVPEYTKDGHTYVESNLWTPVSYQQSVREFAYGEVEEQSWPVTPYTIRVFTEPHCTLSWFDFYVDGVKVDWRVIGGSSEWTSQGFLEENGVREYLFALPRFASDENDRVTSNRKSKIGMIEVVRKHATYLGEVFDKLRVNEFKQANKKDAFGVTQGKHTMSTTKKGNFVTKEEGSFGMKVRHQYSIGCELGRLSVFYHMGHTLQEMGITLKKVDWKQAPTTGTVKNE